MTRLFTPAVREIACGLQFPEGPIALDDGSVLVVEMARQTLTRVRPDGATQVIAALGGGPNGAAIGPDGRCYVCNNGGVSFIAHDGGLIPGAAAADYQGGAIDVVDLYTGKVERLYTHCGDIALRGPNDIVFDASGGFWFTDMGKTFKRARQRDRGAVFYAGPDGGSIRQAVFPLEGPNGIGLSPDGASLYVAETTTGRLWRYCISGPGAIAPQAGALPGEVGQMVFAAPHHAMFDSLAVEESGAICIADIPFGGVSVVSPEGVLIEQHRLPDMITTNLCFGGRDRRTAYVTLSSSGRLVAIDWPRPGLALPWS